VDILKPDAPRTIAYWIENRGMHGVRFWGGGPVAGHRFAGDQRGLATWVDDPNCFAAWEKVLELNIPCNAQATMPEVLPNTRRLLERYGTLKLTLNNLAHVPAEGGAESEAARDLLSLAEYPMTYVNFSVGFVRRTLDSAPAKELLLALLEHFGPRRLLWSSFIRPLKDKPLKESVEVMHQGLAFLSPSDRDSVLGEGARDLYQILRAGAPA
jgi:predicted TIM-barrel fold metal-dependent hydrolase